MKLEGVEAYPLSWPVGRPRTPAHQRAHSNFHRVTSREGSGGYTYRSKTALALGDCRDELLAELSRLGARDVVMSTNLPLRLDGLPYANAKTPDDSGVAVYFTLKGRPTVLACDKWRTIAENLRAVTLHIAAIRGQDRWGVGTLEQAFAGYAALPPATPMGPVKRDWWAVIGVASHTPTTEVVAAYRKRAGEIHPDRSGSHDAMAELNTAIAEFKNERGIA